MEFLIIVIAYIIFVLICPFIENLNLGRHECIRCKQVKRGVKKRNAYLHYLSGYTHKVKGAYMCNECFKKEANGYNSIHKYEEPIIEEEPDVSEVIEQLEKEEERMRKSGLYEYGNPFDEVGPEDDYEIYSNENIEPEDPYEDNNSDDSNDDSNFIF